MVKRTKVMRRCRDVSKASNAMLNFSKLVHKVITIPLNFILHAVKKTMFAVRVTCLSVICSC